jgi:hypothetical protein
MAAEVRTGQRDRVPEPAVEKAYGIQAVTNDIDDLYEQLAARRNWRTRPRRRTRRNRQAGVAAGPAPDRARASAPVASGAVPVIVPANGSPTEPVPGNVSARSAP